MTYSCVLDNTDGEKKSLSLLVLYLRQDNPILILPHTICSEMSMNNNIKLSNNTEKLSRIFMTRIEN